MLFDRYYNCSAASRRRHSISTFITRERSASLASSSKSFKEDLPQGVVHPSNEITHRRAVASISSIDDHSLRHGSFPRKRCNRCTKSEYLSQPVLDFMYAPRGHSSLIVKARTTLGIF